MITTTITTNKYEYGTGASLDLGATFGLTDKK